MSQPCKHCGEYHSCADLIEQQADQIAELEKESANLQHSLKNALIFIDNHKQTKQLSDDYQNKYIEQYWIKKPLSDEEIEIECRKAWNLHDQDQLNLAEVIKFARAIEAKVRGEK